MSDRSTAEDVAYLKAHGLAEFVEECLTTVLPTKDPHPYETLNFIIGNSACPAPFLVTGNNVNLRVANILSATDLDMKQVGTGREYLGSLEFDVFSFDQNGNEIIVLAKEIFEAYDIPTAFRIPPDVLTRFLITIQCNYHNKENRYHNFRHAFNVLQTVHVFLTTYEAKTHFSTLEVFAILFACICHDVQHPGVGNQFLIDTDHALAVRYCNQSPLEHHSTNIAFAIASSTRGETQRKEYGSTCILASLQGDGSYDKSKDFRVFRDLVSKIILRTDLGKKKEPTVSVSSLGLLLQNGAVSFAGNEQIAHREALAVCLVQAGDLGNEIRSFAFSRLWAPLVEEEFHAEGRRRRTLGIFPIPPMLDGDNTDINLAKSQVGFIKFVAQPAYEELALVLKGATFCLGNLANNLATWEQM